MSLRSVLPNASLRPMVRALAVAATAVLVPVASAGAATVTLTSKPPPHTNQADATFAYSGAARYDCALDGIPAANGCSTPILFEGLAEGPHTFSVQDGSGGPAESYSWTIDETAPETTLTAAPADLSNDHAATFEFSSPDATAHFECSLNGAAFSLCTSPRKYTGLGEGTRQFSVHAVDDAGNVDFSPATKTWAVDLTPPDTTIQTSPTSPRNNANISVSFSGDPAGTFRCSLDGQPESLCASPFTATVPDDGNHAVAVRSIDAAGNGDPTPATASWTMDTTAPAAPHVTVNPLEFLASAPKRANRAAVPAGNAHSVGPKGALPFVPELASSGPAFITGKYARAQWSSSGEPDSTTYDVTVTHERIGRAVDQSEGSTADVASGAPRGGAAFKVVEGSECVSAVAKDAVGNESQPGTTCFGVPVGWPTWNSLADGLGIDDKISDHEWTTTNVEPTKQAYDHMVHRLKGTMRLWIGQTGCYEVNGDPQYDIFNHLWVSPVTIECGTESAPVARSSIAIVATICSTCGAVTVNLRGPSIKSGGKWKAGPSSFQQVLSMKANKQERSHLWVIPTPGSKSDNQVLTITRKGGSPEIEAVGVQGTPYHPKSPW